MPISSQEKRPIIVITDCYHPYQDPGDNLDLIQGFASPYVDLKAIILDISNSFRSDTASHPMLWRDPYGPREAGIIQVEQLNYIFGRKIPYAFSPFERMRSEDDKMEYLSDYEQSGVNLLLSILEENVEPIDILSFGSSRTLALAYNREPELLRNKINQIHLCAGRAQHKGIEVTDNTEPMSSVEWNVALDVFAFTRLLRSDLPIAIYPCAGQKGVFQLDENNTYWHLKDMSFLNNMHPQLKCYLNYSFTRSNRIDFIHAMDEKVIYSDEKQLPFDDFHIWETAIWQQVQQQIIVKNAVGDYEIKFKDHLETDDRLLVSTLRSCKLDVYDDGHFTFEYVDEFSNFQIYYRNNLPEYEAAMNLIVPKLFINYSANNE